MKTLNALCWSITVLGVLSVLMYLFADLTLWMPVGKDDPRGLGLLFAHMGMLVAGPARLAYEHRND